MNSNNPFQIKTPESLAPEEAVNLLLMFLQTIKK